MVRRARVSVARDGPCRPRPRLRVPGHLRPHAGGGRGARADAGRRPPPGRGDRRGQRRSWRRSACCGGSSATSCPTAGSICPTTCSAELDWVQASVHGGQRMPRAEMTRRVEEALRAPRRLLPQPSHRAAHRPPPGERAGPRADLRGGVRQGVALEVNGLPPRLDLSGEHVREALRAGVRSSAPPTPTRSGGLGYMELSVATARRGWATADDVLQHPAARRAAASGVNRPA